VQNPVQKATGKLNQWCWKTNKHGGLLHQGFMPQEKNSRVAQCSRHKVPLEPYLRSADLPPTQTPERADSTRSVQMWASWTLGNNTCRWTKILADSSWSSANYSRTGMAKMSFHNPRFRSKHTEVPCQLPCSRNCSCHLKTPRWQLFHCYASTHTTRQFRWTFGTTQNWL
jgi:hypothetical protein